MDTSWIPCGYLMDTSWIPHGYLIDTLWIPHGYLIDTLCFKFARYYCLIQMYFLYRFLFCSMQFSVVIQIVKQIFDSYFISWEHLS